VGGGAESEGRGKDEQFEDQTMPKHFHNVLKIELLCRYKNDGLMVVLATTRKKTQDHS